MKGNKIKSDIMTARKVKDFSSILDDDTQGSMSRPRQEFSYSPVRKKSKSPNRKLRSSLPTGVGRKSIEPYKR